jgi:hypothetical protein
MNIHRLMEGLGTAVNYLRKGQETLRFRNINVRRDNTFVW